MDDNILLAFLFTLFAGLSTGIGSLMALLTKRTNTRFLTVSLGLSAGVMLYVSFIELFAEARHALIGSGDVGYGEVWGEIYTVIAFFGGIILAALIDRMVPSYENPHEIRKVEDMQIDPAMTARLKKVGITSAIAIAIHNFPEGIATFSSVMIDPSLGLPVAVAVAIHNIPEGIAVSAPIFFATGSRKKAFWLSFLSGLSEPIGALFAFLLLMPILNSNPAILGVVMASVAGIMVFISLDELLPAAEEYGEHHWAIYGLVAGMGIMALSLLLL